jgi:hypothetical protein
MIFIYCNWVVQTKERDIYTKGETIQKTIQNTEYAKQKTKQENKHKNNVKKT